MGEGGGGVVMGRGEITLLPGYIIYMMYILARGRTHENRAGLVL